MGIFIGMSPIGNGYLFRVRRENRVVEIDSKDVKFNETFSDCMDRKGRKIKGGKVLDPDLFDEPEMAYDTMKAMDKWKETSRFATPNRFSLNREDNSNDDNDSKKRQLYVTELSLRCWLCRNRLDTRERTERGLGDGAVDKLLVGLGEVNKLNFHRQSSTIVFINIQFSRFSLYFLISTNKTMYIY